MWFSASSAMLVAVATAVAAYGVYQTQLAQQGDMFDRIGSEQASIWMRPTLVSIAGAFVASLVLFVGLWRSVGGKNSDPTGAVR